MGDDNRPVLTVTSPKPGANERFDKIMIGMLDYYSGIAHESLEIKSSLEIAGRNPGENLAALFKPATQGVWVLKLDPPLEKVDYGTLSVSVRDQQGNLTRIERVFSVNAHRNDGPGAYQVPPAARPLLLSPKQIQLQVRHLRLDLRISRRSLSPMPCRFEFTCSKTMKPRLKRSGGAHPLRRRPTCRRRFQNRFPIGALPGQSKPTTSTI